MTAQEESIHLSMREAGVIAGLTYGNPVLPHQVRSGFGLCALAGLPQDEVDQIWAQDGAEITAYLQVFELAASAFQNIPVDADLTDRQREILRLTVDGKTVEEMATLLRVHRRTIETHLAAARTKLGVATTLQAAVIATQQGQL
ncbi:MAG: helix-turn-helix transcriptional regulator [Pseudomonadota bacterium]